MRQLTRREMIKLMGVSAAGATLAAANPISEAQASAPHDVERAPAAVSVPPGYVVETIANVFDLPTAFAFLPDGRILVAEKAGVLKMIENGVVRAQPLIDLRYQVNDYVDRGFIDVAVDPDFTKNHYLYLLYTYRPPDMPHDSQKAVMGHLVRYELDAYAYTLRPNSAKVLLDDYESTLWNHSVDAIRWTNEGYMFVGFGDGALEIATVDSALAALDLDDLRGKLIRIEKENGDGVPGNPFYNPQQPHSARSRVWTYGLRNPFRFAVHPVHNIPYIGNVGDVTYEMLNRGLPGVNYCWPCVEGLINRPDYQVKPPCQDVNVGEVVLADYIYPHNGKNACIIGGDFNFNVNFPPETYGTYFLADYSLQWIKYAALNDAGEVVRVVDFATGMGEPVDLKFGPDGYLYYMSIYSGGFRRIYYKEGGRVPQVKLSASATAGEVPLVIHFSAAGSSSPTRLALTYAWDFGDGTQGQGEDVMHAYLDDGRYLVRLVVTDEKQARATAETLITVGDAAPMVAITAPGDGDVYLPGQTIHLAGRASDLAGQALPEGLMAWRVTLHDGDQARVLLETFGPRATFDMPTASHDGAYVEVLFSGRSRGEKIGATHLHLYLPSQNGYIRSWWISTGFPYATLDDDRLPGGEANYTVKAGDPLFRLVRSSAQSHKVTLLDWVTPNARTMAYAFVWVDVPEDRKGLLGMMSDDGIAVWLNGKALWHNKVSRYMPDDTRDIDLPLIELKKGLNALLVKVDQNDGDWAFKVRVLNPDGSIMTDVTYKTLQS